MSKLEIHNPPVKDVLRRADVLATHGENEWRAVRVIDIRPYLHDYQGAMDTVSEVMVEVDRMRFTPDEARALAKRILESADYADAAQHNGGDV